MNIRGIWFSGLLVTSVTCSKKQMFLHLLRPAILVIWLHYKIIISLSRPAIMRKHKSVVVHEGFAPSRFPTHKQPTLRRGGGSNQQIPPYKTSMHCISMATDLEINNIPSWNKVTLIDKSFNTVEQNGCRKILCLISRFNKPLISTKNPWVQWPTCMANQVHCFLV